MYDKTSQDKWNKNYLAAKIDDDGIPVRVLTENAHLLPERGDALDFASGMAANGIYLARKGLSVQAWDISDVVVNKVNAYANAEAIDLHAVTRDVVRNPPEPKTFDVIIVAHFLERRIFPQLINALRPDGLLFYQTFIAQTTPDYTGPKNPDFRFGSNELLQLCKDLQVLVYREEDLVGHIDHGFRNQAFLVGRKIS